MNTQICATVPKELEAEIIEIAERDNRTFSNTVALLLHNAIKERNRKRNGKKVHVSDNTTNPRTSYAGG